MLPNQKLSEGLSLLDFFSPTSQAAATVTTAAWIAVANHQLLAALIVTGVLGASATLDAKVRQAQDAAGTGAKDIAGKALVQIVKASGDNKQAWINFRPSDLDQLNGFGFVQVSLTVGTAASLIACYLFSLPRYEDAGGFSNASLVQAV